MQPRSLYAATLARWFALLASVLTAAPFALATLLRAADVGS